MTPRAVRMPTALLPADSARRIESAMSLLGRAEEVYEGLLDSLDEHDEVIAELVARVHPEGESDAGE